MADANPLLLLSVVLVVGVASGVLARRFHLPSVTGQILAGVVLGPALGLFPGEVVHRLQPMTHFALGLMAVAVGSHLHLRRLRNAKKRLGLLVLCESTITPVLVATVVMVIPGGTWPLAILLGTIAISTAPATTLAIVKEARAKGVFVKTLVAAVALNNIACICLFELAHTAARVRLDPNTGISTLAVVLAPFRTVLLSALLGGAVGGVLILATRRIVRPDRLTALSLIAILFTAGLADDLAAYGFSTLLACLFLGVVLANLTPDKEEIGHEVLSNLESAVFAVFFTLAGMELELDSLALGGLMALAVFGARVAGKVSAATLAMRLADATQRVRSYLGWALIPQAGLAVGLMLLVAEDPVFGDMRDLFLAVVLSTVTLNELVGPLLTRWSLVRSGDYRKDRARLIDFLHEENIVTDLSGASKEDVIKRLTDVLITTNHVRVERAALLQSILDREAQGSTCVGEGMMIPHGALPDGDEIVGAMGISREGLDFPTPDGRLVHCVVLLATPAAARTRHLEVLAALARSVGGDKGIQQQLFHAKSPAHAYELLHADEESEDFNYFLDDQGA